MRPSAKLATSDPAPRDAAAIALWVALAALAIARAAAPFAPGMALWSLNLPRFLAPAAAWIPWAIATAALVPTVSRRAVGAFARAGDAFSRGGVLALLLAAIVPLVAVALLPDRTWFLGDFQLRQATLEGARGELAFWYPYCLPLDLLLHDTLARALIARFDLIANDAGRLLGAAEAALLGMVAARFARATSARGAAALLAWTAIVFGGTLTLFTGYGKAFTEMTLLAAAAGTCALEIAQERATLLPLGLVVSVALFVHRSALGFVPGFAVMAAFAWRSARGGDAAVRVSTIAGTLLPIAALAIELPRTLAIIRRTDAMHFTPADVQRLGLLRATLAPERLLDLFNVLVLLVPLAIAAVLVAAFARRAPGPRREWLALASLALPFVVVTPFVHPSQGLMRDWDTLAAPAMTLSMVAAWVLARALEVRPRFAWLALAATLAVMAPTLQWMMHFADRDRGLARVEALLAGPPERAAHERASAWESLANRRMDLGDADRAAAAFEREAAIEPSPQTLRRWATVEAMRGDLDHAREIQHDLLKRYPTLDEGWMELAILSMRAGDRDESRRAASEALRLNPSRRDARSLLESLGPAPPAR